MSKVFLSILVEGGHGFLTFFKGGHLQKSFGNPLFTHFSLTKDTKSFSFKKC